MPKASLTTQIGRGLASLLFGCVLGLVITSMPKETLPVVLILGVPFYACMERLLTRKVGWLPFGPVRLVMASLVIGAVAMAPKSIDRIRLETLPDTIVTLDQVAEFGGRMISLTEEARLESVRLPSRRPTLREFVEAVESQTELKVSIGYCGWSASAFSDGYPMFLNIR